MALNTEEILLTHGIPSPISDGDNFINCSWWANLTASNIYPATITTTCGDKDLGISLRISCNFCWDHVDNKCELNWCSYYRINRDYNRCFCDLSSN